MFSWAAADTFGPHFWKSPVESGFKAISHVEFDLNPISPIELDFKALQGSFWPFGRPGPENTQNELPQATFGHMRPGAENA